MTTLNNEFLGDKIRRLRKKQGLTQPELAFLIGVHETTIRRWENNNDKPKLRDIKKLAEVLHVSEDELLNGAPESTWVLSVKIADSVQQEVIDVTKKVPCVSSIVTTPQGGYMCLGGDYSLWADDALFKKMINDMKKFRDVVLSNGRAMGGIKD